MAHKNYIRLLAAILAALLLAVPVSGSAGSRLAVEREVYEYLTNELKLSTAAACGVLANIEHESAFQPTIVGDKGTSYGLCQWHNERYTALRSYCRAIGLNYQTVEGQMAYLKYELGTNYVNLLLALQSLENTPEGAYRAAHMWCIQFERPSDMQAKAAARGELARGKYWARYSNYESITIVLPEAEEPEIDPGILIEQLRQNPVTIPVPPEEDRESSRNYVFPKPGFIYYTPRNLPKTEAAPEPTIGWEIPALTLIFAAMVVVWFFPTKKVCRREEDMV